MRPDQGRAIVTGVGSWQYPPLPLLLLTFRKQGERVVIESRRGYRHDPANTFANGEIAEAAAWPVIERCAGQPVVVKPPLD